MRSWPAGVEDGGAAAEMVAEVVGGVGVGVAGDGCAAAEDADAGVVVEDVDGVVGCGRRRCMVEDEPFEQAVDVDGDVGR